MTFLKHKNMGFPFSFFYTAQLIFYIFAEIFFFMRTGLPKKFYGITSRRFITNFWYEAVGEISGSKEAAKVRSKYKSYADNDYWSAVGYKVFLGKLGFSRARFFSFLCLSFLALYLLGPTIGLLLVLSPGFLVAAFHQFKPEQLAITFFTSILVVLGLFGFSGDDGFFAITAISALLVAHSVALASLVSLMLAMIFAGLTFGTELQIGVLLILVILYFLIQIGLVRVRKILSIISLDTSNSKAGTEIKTVVVKKLRLAAKGLVTVFFGCLVFFSGEINLALTVICVGLSHAINDSIIRVADEHSYYRSLILVIFLAALAGVSELGLAIVLARLFLSPLWMGLKIDEFNGLPSQEAFNEYFENSKRVNEISSQLKRKLGPNALVVLSKPKNLSDDQLFRFYSFVESICRKANLVLLNHLHAFQDETIEKKPAISNKKYLDFDDIVIPVDASGDVWALNIERDVKAEKCYNLDENLASFLNMPTCKNYKLEKIQ